MQGDDLKELRKELNLTQDGLAARLGLTATFIGMMERDEKPIEPRTVLAVLALYTTQPMPHVRAIDWKETEAGRRIAARVLGFDVTITKTAKGRWAAGVTHGRTGFSPEYREWCDSLDTAKVTALLSIQIGYSQIAANIIERESLAHAA